jgi:hypothetical protein
MKKLLCLLPVIALLIYSCSGGSGKKLLVITSGKFTVDQKTINLEPGNQHNEQELKFTDKDKVTIAVKTSEGEKTYEISEDGSWLLNLKKDTVIGSLVNYGNTGTPGSITAEELNRIIDSTRQLMAGTNASFEKKSFFLPPNSIQKISNSSNAVLLSPYKLIPGTLEVGPDGKAPEYYKFFTNSQKREALEEMLQRLTK